MSVCSSQNLTRGCAVPGMLLWSTQHPGNGEISPRLVRKWKFRFVGKDKISLAALTTNQDNELKHLIILSSWTKIFWKGFLSILSVHSAMLLYCSQIHSNNNSSALMYMKTWDLLHLKSQATAWSAWSSAAWPWAGTLKMNLKKEKAAGVIMAGTWLLRNTEQNTNRISFHEI